MRRRLSLALSVAALAAVAACFDPTYPESLPCEPSGWCPSGQICGPDLVCLTIGGADATPGDARTDATWADAGQGELLSISIGPDVSMLVGETHQFVVTATYEGGDAQVSDGVIWQSSNNAIAYLDFTGLATAAAAGEATVTARYQGRADAALVTVTSP